MRLAKQLSSSPVERSHGAERGPRARLRQFSCTPVGRESEGRDWRASAIFVVVLEVSSHGKKEAGDKACQAVLQ